MLPDESVMIHTCNDMPSVVKATSLRTVSPSHRQRRYCISAEPVIVSPWKNDWMLAEGNRRHAGLTQSSDPRRYNIHLSRVYVEYDYEASTTRLNLLILIREHSDFIEVFSALHDLRPQSPYLCQIRLI